MIWRCVLPAIAAIALAVPARAEDQVDPWSCPAWIAIAERDYGIPPLLLQAIGRVEAGEAIDQGRAGAWILDIGGQMVQPASLASALDTIILSREPSIDVGCLQINLRAHGTAVLAPGWLLYPKYNAAYGAWYLVTLFQRYRSWAGAVAAYHAGRDTERGQLYCHRVSVVLFDMQRSAGPGLNLSC
jgi:hypothetical protein